MTAAHLRPDTIGGFMRHRLPWAWATRWWPAGPAALFTIAACDPYVVGGRSLVWSLAWAAAAVAALSLIVWPLADWARYAACFTGGLVFAGRSAMLVVSEHTAPVAWVAPAAWAICAVMYTTLLALSWWVALNYPRPPRRCDDR